MRKEVLKRISASAVAFAKGRFDVGVAASAGREFRLSLNRLSTRRLAAYEKWPEPRMAG